MNQTKKDIRHGLPQVWNLEKLNAETAEWWSAGAGSRETVVKGHKLPGTRRTRPGDLCDSMETMLNDTGLRQEILNIITTQKW